MSHARTGSVMEQVWGAVRAVRHMLGGATGQLTTTPAPHYPGELAGLQEHLATLEGKLALRERELAQVQEALRASEVRLGAFLESSVIGVMVGDLRGAITEANDAFLWMVGYTREDLAAGQLSWVDLTAPEHRHADMQALGRLQRRRIPPPYEKEYVRKDGSRIPVIVVGISLLAESTDRFITFALPLIERRSSEEALSASEGRLAGVIASVTDPIITVDDERRVVVFNPAAERLFRCSAAEALGKKLDRFIPERFRRAQAEQIEFFAGTDAAGESPGALGTLVFRRANGDEFSVEVTVSQLTAGGKTLHTLVLRDVTARRRAEGERARLLERERDARAEAEAANRTKDEFLATLSHELRTPLSAMLTWARLLRMGKLDGPTTSRALETIERNIKVLAQLIDDLLDVSRIIAGKLHLDVRPVEIASVIGAALEDVQPAADAKGVGLGCVLDPAANVVMGDPSRLQQVVWNLLSNAIKFTPRGGRVEVRLDRADSLARIVVTDTGRGISPDFLPHIFQRFRQADSTSTRVHGGLGLGLAIVRHLVELHGGTVEAASPGEGSGATFTVGLPLAVIRAEANGSEQMSSRVSPSAMAGDGPNLGGLRVLLVDDHPDSRDWATAVLQACGARVTAVASATEALAVLDRFKPDVLVSDIAMPEQDGYELIRRVRARPAEEGGRIPAAAMTAYARAEDRSQALRAGYQIHLPKPVEPAELVAVVASLAERTGAA